MRPRPGARAEVSGLFIGFAPRSQASNFRQLAAKGLRSRKIDRQRRISEWGACLKRLRLGKAFSEKADIWNILAEQKLLSGSDRRRGADHEAGGGAVQHPQRTRRFQEPARLGGQR